MSYSDQLHKSQYAGIGMTSDRTRKRLIDQLRTMGINDTNVLDVMQSLPRHVFVDEALASRAYENTALPIGHGQTISQPYTVALMTQTLLNKPRAKVLEIGTGCGYQTAVLAPLCTQVVSIERIVKLHRAARDRLYDLGVRNVVFRHGDGFAGMTDYAPFDGILAAAVSEDVPPELIDQLAIGGRVVMPVGRDARQHLIVIDKTSNGLVQQEIEAVRFVPRLAGLG
ncbi:protein-L-isoaspartate(D-aspartate) O-methyltransferase [Arenicella xantha]|uniref:Protein-L-isoaspartate O-methyltransferase n=1 Tax=Arenicella xantha TaxID=644221 RepID=A0A395JL92_9GAMM|nr:protein-L-isoaspartate(D-aspartate) O-methyltransferase [Arenicella xantha]RBP51369.1 protein-L-isoaspartate(D-aspartate) O-methyltransferase [Arenicella xantha]